jgi:hypothetical protein
MVMQTYLFDVSPSNVPIQYNSSGKPQNKHRRAIGRAPTYLTGPELKEALQYYFSSNVDEKQRILQRFGPKKIRHAMAICKLDVGKQGKIGRYVCSHHGKQYLVYNWCGASGVRIRCFPPGGCSTNTHFDFYLFQGAENQFEDSAEM